MIYFGGRLAAANMPIYFPEVNSVHFVNSSGERSVSEQIDLEHSPAGRRRQRVRGAILEAAERVFATEGEAGLSIRRLADAIDYSPSAIYNYFGSKEELIEELKEAFFSRLMSSMDMAAFQALPFDQRIRRCFMNYIEVATDRPHHYLAAFSSSAGDASSTKREDWEAFQKTEKGKAFGTVISIVQEGQQAGQFDPSLDPVHAARSLWASMHGLAQLLISVPNFGQGMPATAAKMDNHEFTAFHVGLMIRSLQRQLPASANDETHHV